MYYSEKRGERERVRGRECVRQTILKNEREVSHPVKSDSVLLPDDRFLHGSALENKTGNGIQSDLHTLYITTKDKTVPPNYTTTLKQRRHFPTKDSFIRILC